MTSISNLATQDALIDSDQFPVWSATNGDARKVPARVLAEYVNSKNSSSGGSTGGGSTGGGSTNTTSIVHSPFAKTNAVKLWEKFNTGEPIYSTPIFVPDFVSTLYSGPVFIYQSWDWYLYVVKASDGATVWRYAFGGPNYGRAQYLKVGANAYIFGASHEGYIYCLDSNGNKLWHFANLYYREQSGTLTYNGSGNCTDATKNWATNSFLRSITDGTYNATITITIGGTPTPHQIKSCSGTGIAIYSPSGSLVNGNTYSYTVTPKYSSDIYYQHAGTAVIESGVGYLYVTGFDNQVVKLSMAGAAVWKYSTLENIEPFPLVGDVDGDNVNEVVVSSVDGHMYIFNGTTGALEGSYTAAGGFDAFVKMGAIKGGTNQFIISGCRDGRVYSVNGTTKALDSKSTAFTALGGDDIDSGVALYDTGFGTYNIIMGNDPGFVVSLDYNLNVLWRLSTGLLINSTPEIFYVGTTQLIALFDMAGGVTLIQGDGTILSQFHVKGGIEGTPYISDVNNDGYPEMLITTIDGNVFLYSIRGITT